MNANCIKCGSGSIIPTARVSDVSELDSSDLRVTIARNRNAFVGQQAISDVKTTVCGFCGYIELYASDPAILLDAYLEDERTKHQR